MQFDEASVSAAPAAPGVYFLYGGERLLYVGIAVHGTGIRQELEKHRRGDHGPRTRAATAFEYELTRDPVVASREYLLAHMAQNRGRLPPCNRLEGLAGASRGDARELRADQ
jgi:hypothetical protein